MTNSIYIDIDSEREQPIVFGKPPDIPQPTNREEAQKMILNDIAGITAALTVLIAAAHDNGYGDAKELVEAASASLSSVLTVPRDEPETEGPAA